jgi:hypothetical protein
MQTLSPHYELIKSQLPAWIHKVPPDVRADFRDSLLGSNQARHDLQALFHRLQSPAAFAAPLLREALKTWLFGLLTDENALLVREWKHHHLLGLIRNHEKTTRQTLLEAALQNFEAEEAAADGMEKGTALYNITDKVETLSPVSPATFATLCRRLDLGAQYLKHINDVLEPTNTAAQVLALFKARERHAFGVALHIAYMQQQFTPRQYLQLHSLQSTGSHMDIACSHLTLNNLVLPNVLIIEASAINLPFILYTPDDPEAVFRRHRSREDLQHSLAARLEDTTYRAFFNRLVPLQHQQTLLGVTPASITAGKLSLTRIHTRLFRAMASRRIAQIKGDARILAVPTADADLMSRQKRLQGYRDLGKSLLFFAASFIPIVGEVMLVVAAGELIHTVYNGFAAWSRGDSDEALNDFLDVVDNVALAAATAGAIKTAGVATRLVKVHVHNQGWRLWHSDLAPYRNSTVLPDSLAPDSQGMYRHEQQHFVKLDDQAYAVERAPDAKHWQLVHPSDPQAYSPPLLSNGVGSWRTAHESPQDWNDLKLIKRMGPDAAHITQPAVESILLLSGADTGTLRQSHLDNVRPPPLLRDTVKHFNLEQEINDFNIERAEGKSVTPYSPFIQFHLVCGLPEWPADYVLKVVDEQQSVLLSHGTGPNEIKVAASRFRNGELLHVLEQQMPQIHFNELMPKLYIDYFSKTENLAIHLQGQVSQQKQRLFALLVQPGEKPLTPVESDINAVMPELTKSHREEIGATLNHDEQQSLHQERCLPPEQQWEAEQYIKSIRATNVQKGIYLDSMHTPESVPLILHTLEQMPGWPGSRKIEVYDASNSGPLLGNIGSGEGSARYILIRQGEQYAVQSAEGTLLQPPDDLFSALEYTLSKAELEAFLSQSGASSLKQAIRKNSLALTAGQTPHRVRLSSQTTADTPRQPLNPQFAEQVAPQGMTLRTGGIYQTPARADGSHDHYILENEKYYRVKAGGDGWQLVDSRSPFRGYKPYVQRSPDGTWAINLAKGGLPGGMQSSQVPLLIKMESSEGFESAHSSSDYESAEEGTVATLFTPRELRKMRSDRSYQHSQNYRRIYDRANNGRYPLRNLRGQPMRIRSLQTRSKSLTSNATFSSDLIKPYIRWEGYEQVARLYEDKLEVTPFTAAHQKAPEESVMIGESTVITRKTIKKGETLGVYGGEQVPNNTAAYRRDPYLLDIRAPGSSPAANVPNLSGDNVLSRINTIFEYEAGQPIRQAATGYNVEVARFTVETQVGDEPRQEFALSAFFASEDIPATAELRWNYQYNEATINALFGPLP